MITRATLRFVLISITIVQTSWAKPKSHDPQPDIALLKSKDLCLQKTKYNDLEPSEKDRLQSPSNQLIKFALKGFQEASLQYAEKAKNITAHLLKDGEILNAKSAKILQFKHNLTQFEEKYSTCDNIDELFELVESYSNTTSFYFQQQQTTPDDDDDTILILTLLRKYGSDKLDEESLELFNGFVKRFNKKFKDLKEDLQKVNNKLSQKLLEWNRSWHTNENSKNVLTYGDKNAAFEKFFTIFEEEEQ